MTRYMRIRTIAFMMLMATPLCAEEGDRSQVLFRQGVEAGKAGDMAAAYRYLTQAWALRPSYDIATNLAQAAFVLEKYPEAAERFAYALRHYPATGNAENRQQTEKFMAMAREKVARLKLEVTPKEASVFIDGEPKGRADSLPPEVFVLPGEREVSASYGEQTVKRVVIAQAARDFAITLDVPAPVQAEPAKATNVSESGDQQRPESTPDDSYQQPSQNWTPVWIAGGVGVLGLATGITFLATSSSKASNRDDHANETPGTGACADGTPEPASDCADATELADSAATHRALAWTGFGVALAGGVAAVLLWPRSQEDPGISWHLAPLTPEGQPGITAGVSGAF